MKKVSSDKNCIDCIFKNFPSEATDLPGFSDICKERKIKKYLKGTDIIYEGDEISEFIYLKSGLVKLYKRHPEDQDQIIRIAQPLNFIGLLSVFSERTYNYSVTAIEDSEVCCISLSLVKELIKLNGEFALNILGKISKTTDDIIRTNLEIGKKNLRGRIAYILLFFSKDVYQSASFEIPISRQEIAELIDMTAENVIRIISEFGKDKIIKVKKKQIEILDTPKLQKICDLG